MSETTLTEADIARVVDRFYDAVQAHPTLGPVFNPAVHDWPDHTATLVRFWSSVPWTMNTGRRHFPIFDRLSNRVRMNVCTGRNG